MAGSSAASRKGWANMTPSARAARLAKLARNRKAFTSEEASAYAKAAWKNAAFREKQSLKTKEQLKSKEFQAKAAKGRVGGKKPASFGPFISAHAKVRWASYSKERKAQILKPAWTAQQMVPSGLEYKIRSQLEAMGIPFIPQQPIGPYFVDIYVPSLKRVVECDGEYWHSKPKAIAFDKRRDSYMRNHGYSIVRLSGTEINLNAKAAAMRAIKC